jgi:signal transduction histidine kinase
LRDESGNLVGFSKITRDVTEKRAQEEALRQEVAAKEKAQRRLQQSEESLRRLSLNLLRTQDEERRRIGREMHDSLGQYLSVLKLKLGMLKANEAGLSMGIRTELDQCTAVLEECVKEVRTISYLLYPPMLEEMGLRAAIAWYLEGFSQRSNVKTILGMADRFGRLSRDTELVLFRVLQESLTNVHKHSGSSSANISVLRDSNSVTLEVRDFGKGLPESFLNQSQQDWSQSLGVGLRGMSERIRQLGGELAIETVTPGTLVRAIVPAVDGSLDS